MNTIQITNDLLNKRVENKPSRFDMAINFYCCVKMAGKYFLVAYYYNPAWNLFYPFYDDVNKTPILKESRAKTYGELIKEANEIIKIDLNEKLKLAQGRFVELVGCGCKVKPSKTKELFELKYSKTANLFTIYKLYNFIITEVDNVDTMLNPKNLKCELFELDSLENSKLVGNAKWFVDESINELKASAIKVE